MVCTLMDHRTDVEMFKTQVEPWATGEWFHRKVLNILTSFESMVHVKSMENCCRFVFYNNIDRLYCRFPLKFPRNSCVLQWQKQIVSPSAHFLCLYTHWTWLLKNNFACAAHFFVHFFAVALHDYNVKLPDTSSGYTFYGGNVICVPICFFSLLLIFSLVQMATSISHFLTATIKFKCFSSSEFGLLYFFLSL